MGADVGRCECKAPGSLVMCGSCGATRYSADASGLESDGIVLRAGHAADSELTSHAPPTPRNDKPRRLLTRTEFAELRAYARRDSDESRILDAYETAVRLLEEVVRAPRAPLSDRVEADDIAWLVLREAER